MGTKITKIIFWIAIILGILNLLNVFTPEIGFDALWYHLTLPKLWLLKRQYYFPGGLLYYSVMPRLTEWLYTPLIFFTGTVGPKFVQFFSALAISILIYKIAKLQKLSNTFSLLAGCLFYLSYLVSWQSSSAYIDLFRSLLEIAALYFFLQNRKVVGSLFLGLSLGTKWLSFFSVVIYSLVFGWQVLPFSLLCATPWFLTAIHFTGNPVFPLFDPVLQNGIQPMFFGVLKIFTSPVQFTFPFDDFISPVAGLLFSLSGVGFLFTDKTKRQIINIGLLGGFSTLILNPPSARFFLPYYPAVILGAIFIIEKLPTKIKTLFLLLFLLSSFLVLLLRINAFQKNLAFLAGHQTTNQYLTSLSSRLPNTFIDSDDFIKNNLANQKILVDKLHNLYYFPYPFDHTSWVQSQNSYNYLITKDQSPDQINGQLIHTNSLGIQVFKLNQ